MLKTEVNNKYEFEIKINNKKLLIDDQYFPLDIAEIGKETYHLLKGKKSYNAEIIDFDSEEKSFLILVNGREYEVKVADRYDLLLEELGMEEMEGAKIDQVEAPMPGKVLSIHVKEGQEIQKDEKLLVLEAMKMENVIKAPDDGVVSKISVNEEEAVEKKQLLIELE